MAVSLKRREAQHQGRGYSMAESRRLAQELGGVSVPAKWDAASQSWEFGGPGWNPVGLPHIVVLPLAIEYRGKAQYVTLADNQGPTKTAAEVLATYGEMG